MTAPTKKIETLRRHMAAGNWEAAITLAAKWPRLGQHRQAITRAASAILRPAFYRQLGQDPNALVEAGKAALIERYQSGH